MPHIDVLENPKCRFCGECTFKEINIYEDIECDKCGKSTDRYFDDSPYLTTMVEKRAYNPDYGDDRICECGHPYYRHFDTYEEMDPVGCKYCGCYEFKEKVNVPEEKYENIEGVVVKFSEGGFKIQASDGYISNCPEIKSEASREDIAKMIQEIKFTLQRQIHKALGIRS